MKQQRGRVIEGRIITIALAAAFALLTAIPALAQTFTPGNLVVTVEGNGVEGASSGPYTDNQAAPLTLFQFSINGTTSATYVNSYVLPQTASGANSPVSGEYGSSSEGTLQLSGDGNYLTVMGYGVNASDFNMDPGSFSVSPSNTALGQSGSMTGQTYTPVPRVVALIDANGDLDSTTALYNIFNANNPRSIYTADDTNLYVSGQGNSPDATGGILSAGFAADVRWTRGLASALPSTMAWRPPPRSAFAAASLSRRKGTCFDAASGPWHT